MYRKIIYSFLILITLASIITLLELHKREETLSRFGSSGNEVTQIQTKLKNWGYYAGSIDGIYGSRTVSAVRSFQRKNGLTIDGIAGPKTLAAMGIQSSSSNSSNDSNNLNLLARVINGEARGEPYNGMVAVGAVI